MAAALMGFDDVCKLLIEKGADINAADDDGQTPLYGAAYEGHAKTVAVLAEAGADLEARDSEGTTPLIAASWNNKLQVAQLLIEKGADINAANTDGRTPLLAAAWKGYPDIIELLVGKGAEIDKVDLDGRSPLWAAARAGDPYTIEMLCDKNANPALKDKRRDAFGAGAGVASCTPLFAASWQGHTDTCRMLLHYGAGPKDGDEEGRTPMEVAPNDEIKMMISEAEELAANNEKVKKPKLPPKPAPIMEEEEDALSELPAVFRRRELKKKGLGKGSFSTAMSKKKEEEEE
mmetsp:Transcript_64937/g.205142  ORF Transcript_64937/g.205142 Transcript_64937/m.205142 type:complete len:290 (+) Transcript_64937:943-1812(+)